MIYPPLPHQVAPIENGLELLGKTKVLAYYDFFMGLGKTYISLNIAQTLYSQRKIHHVVVVCPKTVVSGWQDQITEHLEPPTQVLQWDSQKAKSPKYGQAVAKHLTQPESMPIFLVNVEAFQLENPVLDSLLKNINAGSTLVILDEAIKIKDSTTKRTTRVFKTFDPFDYKIGLSGRSITEGPLDSYAMYRFFGKTFWPWKSFFNFKQYYAILKDSYGAEGRIFKQVVGFQRLDDLRSRVQPITIQGRIEDAGLNLPEKIDAPLLFDLSREEQRVYDELKKHLRAELASGSMISKTAKIALFSTFRMVTGGWASTTEQIEPGAVPTKLRVLLDDLEDASGNAVVCAEFRHEIRQVAEALKPLGSVVILSGLQSSKDNDEAKRLFADGLVRFLVADNGMVARGLNLQKHCALMIDYSMTPSCDEFDQHRARIHRIGQKDTCVYKQVMARGTVDEHLLKLLKKKIELSNQFADGTMADIINLV
jgi:SNF2 family DNA or RNA helicase